MKKVLVELYCDNIEVVNNEDICDILEHRAMEIESVIAANVIDVRDYRDYEADVENYSHCNFGYEN